jgi:hypothetical protein
VQNLLEGERDVLTRRLFDLAMSAPAKDAVQALRIIFDRISPAPRDRAIRVNLPAVTDAVTVTDALAGILEAVASGMVTPSEGIALAGLAEGIGRSLEREDLEDRLAALEERFGGDRS